MRPKLSKYLLGAALVTVGAAVFMAARAPQRDAGARPPDLLRRTTSVLALSGNEPLPQRLRKKGLQ